METGVTKYDPTKLMDAVKDRIRAEFVGMIPDDVWKDMVKKEVDEFFRYKDRSYSRTTSSDFGELIRGVLLSVSELTVECKKRLKEYFESAEWQGVWVSDSQREGMSEAMGKLIVKVMPEIQLAIFGDIAQGIVRDALTRMRSQVY